MPDTFIPSRESELVTWAATFNSLITATPTAFGLTAPQATAFAALFTAFDVAYATANARATRTPSAIVAKNEAKVMLIDGPGGIRQLARIVQATPSVTNEQRSDLGLTVRDVEPTPVPVPTDAPEIDFIPTGSRTIRLRLHNETTLSRKKPEGVKGATVFSFVGETAPSEVSEWTFQGNTTKTVVEIDMPPGVAGGSKVWFTAFWFNPKTQSGPPATPVSTYVQMGGLSMAA